MGLVILRFWPVLIPLIVYWLWIRNVRRKALAAGKSAPLFREGPWYWAVLASLLTAALCFVLLGLSEKPVKGDYVPPHLENGKIIPGHTE
jgi:hypothetical protein